MKEKKVANVSYLYFVEQKVEDIWERKFIVNIVLEREEKNNGSNNGCKISH